MLIPPTEQTPDSVLSAIPTNTSSSNPHFLIFFASVEPDTGRSWCPDCRVVEPTIDKHVPDNNSTWKTPDNAYRKAFGISAVPTILRVESADKSSLSNQLSSARKLVEGEILDEVKLKDFLKA
ncbi:hypothetical protein OIO90_000533 [Microbotryomycetes sp. JL221]|nr:hypothetical protein OIO90_000533 [Microbotryomycetes sp. JL221]